MITDKSVREAIEILKAVETAWKITVGMFMGSRSHTQIEHRKDLTALTTAIEVMYEWLLERTEYGKVIQGGDVIIVNEDRLQPGETIASKLKEIEDNRKKKWGKRGKKN